MRLIFLTIVIATAIGLLSGGSLRDFPSVRLRWWPLALAGVAVQWAPVPSARAFVALLASLTLLLVFAIVNFRGPGFILILAGLLLNAIVIASNHGMPVTERALVRSGQEATLADLRTNGGAKHHLAGDNAVLLPIGDVIGIPPPIGQAVSVGDLAVHLGVAWFIVVALRPLRPASIES